MNLEKHGVNTHTFAAEQMQQVLARHYNFFK
jgi:hypothetical protein